MNKEEVKELILEYSELKWNWDGHKGSPPCPNAATNSNKLVELLYEVMLGHLCEVYPCPNGTIEFEFNNSNGLEYYIEVGNQSMTYYIIEEGKEGYRSADHVPVHILFVRELLDFLKLN